MNTKNPYVTVLKFKENKAELKRTWKTLGNVFDEIPPMYPERASELNVFCVPTPKPYPYGATTVAGGGRVSHRNTSTSRAVRNRVQ